MLNIAICDDNSIFLKQISDILRGDERISGVSVFNDPDALIERVSERNNRPDAVFMDIEFDRTKNGIGYAQEIFCIDPRVQVIYVTGYNDRYAQHVLLSDSNLCGYMTKPLEKEILDRYIDKLCRRKGHSGFLTFSMNGKEYSVSPEDIIYLESNNHRITIYTDDQEYQVYEKLAEVSKRLPSVFVSCHKSFLVNLNRVKRMDKSSFVMTDGSNIPISKRSYASTKEKFFNHLGKYI